MHKPSSSQRSRKQCFPNGVGSRGKGMNKIQYERKPLVSNFIAQRRERRRVGQTLPRFSSQSGHSRQGGYREGRHLHLLCPQLAPSFSSTPRGHPGGAAQADGRGRGRGRRRGPGELHGGRQRQDGPGRAGGLPRGGSWLPAPRPARPGGGGNAGASSPRPAARTRPWSPAPTPPAARRPPP